jgi:replicative DNA helicase
MAAGSEGWQMIDRDSMRPPHSSEAEQAVLGAMLMSSGVIDSVAAVLSPEQFYYSDHRAICSTALRLHAANKPVDPVTVYEAGGHDVMYLNTLVQGCPSPSSAPHYAEIVAEFWRSRELMRVGCDIADDAVRRANPDQTAAERIDRGVTSLMAIVQSDGQNEPELMGSLTVAFLDRLQDRADGKDTVVATGLHDLDEFTAGGIRSGELWVIGARPSMGKTALTLTISRNIGERPDDGALFCSQEDSKDTAAQRFVASIGRVSLAHLRTGKLSDDEWGRVSDAVEKLSTLNLAVDDDGSLTLLDVRRKVQQARRRMGKRLKVVVIDYLQLMTGEGANRNIELGQISNGLKGMAKSLDVGVILLSQLSRKADERPGAPQMSDLRDSGDIEGAADFIGLLWRPYMRHPTEENKHYAELHIAKQKNGPTGSVHLSFDGAYQQFGRWSGPIPKTTKQKAATSTGGFE